MPTVSVIIPTYNGRQQAGELMRALAAQSLRPTEVIVLDSQSSDGTLEAFQSLGARVKSVERDEFHHSTVRNHGAQLAHGQLLVFMTQDALPSQSSCFEHLAGPLLDGRASAAFARQVPYSDATPLERFARETNYPAESRTSTDKDIARIGVRAFFFSNSCSMVRRDVFEELGGFPSHTVMNEDMLFAARLLRAGHRIAYVADALVIHSHCYSLAQTLKRYFDIGVVFEQARTELSGLPLGRDGAVYVRKLLTQLARERNYHWMPLAVAESAVKILGVSLGKSHRRLPLAWTKRLSMHPQYWSRGP
jgi:rhamnosyltransferase